MDVLNQIKEKITGFYQKETTQGFITVTPYLNDAIEWVKDVSKYSNDIKLYDAWKCINQDSNIEMSVNQLYNYVSNEDRAFFISDSFRKIILCNSRLSSSIIAYIMGEIIKENREFRHDDALLYNALSQMTDYDVRNFKYLMENTLGRFSDDDNIIDERKILENRESINITIQVCLANALFETKTTVSYDNSIYNGIFRAATDIANRLLEYIKKVYLLLNYGI